MIRSVAMSEQVDRYVRGELNAAETAAFEAELLESPPLQDALEAALGLQRALEFERNQIGATVVPLQARSGQIGDSPFRWQVWGMAASLVAAAVAGSLWWYTEAENVRLNARIDQLTRPVDSVLTVPLDVMRSVGPEAPEVFIRKPQGAAVLILDVEVAEQLVRAPELNLELIAEQGDELAGWSAAPDADGRIRVAHRTDLLPDGRLTLRISDPVSGGTDTRSIELLPAR